MIKIGMIGMSYGNAHPYSWSAIINGFFDSREITDSGFPAVAAYLTTNRSALGIPGVTVTHIWSQERKISENIAKATLINNIVEYPEEMIGAVDAVILARDDAEYHVQMAMPFLKANLPVFIDKPLALTHEELSYFAEENNKGKLLMSCSSMRYANECIEAKKELHSLGTIQLISGVGKKDWSKYGIHLLEGACFLLGDKRISSVRHIGKKEKEIVQVSFENGPEAVFSLFQHIPPTFQLSIFGDAGWKTIDIKDYYSMFRQNILAFVAGVRAGKSILEFSSTENIVRGIIAGNESFAKDGSVIKI